MYRDSLMSSVEYETNVRLPLIYFTVFCRMHAVIGNGIRSHAARAFVYPVLERGNLHVLLQSTVTKVTG